MPSLRADAVKKKKKKDVNELLSHAGPLAFEATVWILSTSSLCLQCRGCDVVRHCGESLTARGVGGSAMAQYRGGPRCGPRESLPSLGRRHEPPHLPPHLPVLLMDLTGSMRHDYKCGNVSLIECLLLTSFSAF